MTASQLTVFASVGLSLIFSYIPGIKPRWDALEPDWKRLYMLLMLLAVTLGVAALSCGKIIPSVPCDQPGLIDLAITFVSAVIANQSAYSITPSLSVLFPVKSSAAMVKK
jgi:hypothetical protein